MRIVLLFFTLFTISFQSAGQGCADAGFCTMGAMRPDQAFSKKVNLKVKSVEVLQYYGRTKTENNIWAWQVDFNVGITDKITAQFKVPYMYANGHLGENQGIGDASISLSRNLLATEQFQINATVGAKIALNRQDATSEDGLPLPMYYQTSLGTNDFVCGISIMSKKWLIAAGWQQPLTRQNNNEFRWAPWWGHPDWWWADKYAESQWLRRRADYMLRIQRDFRFSKWAFNVGTLSIFRFRKDSWWNDLNWQWEDAPGSDGAAHSLLTSIAYNFSTKSSIKIANGWRLQRRDHNPDGLSREYVNTISYFYKF